MTQRQRILDALLSVTASLGLDAVSVRSVATAAGVSPAQVQYYFRAKDHLLTAAFEHVHERMDARGATVDASGSAADVLRRYLLTWLPLDAERRADASVWLAFTAAAITSAPLEKIVHETDAVVTTALAELIALGQAEGDILPSLKPAVTASLVLAVVDGLTVRALTHPEPEHVLPALDQFLDSLTTAPQGRS